MATLQKKTVVVVGGSSGIGFAVALASLQSLASVVIIASSNKSRIEDAVARLKAHKLPGQIREQMLDAKDSEAIKAFASELGPVDHIVWTSGDVPKGMGIGLPYSNVQSVEEGQGIFTIRFWGPFVLAKHAKFHSGGSFTLTSGVAGQRPPPGGVLASSTTTALAGLTRGLAVDLAPVRVNAICAGLIDTELVEKMFGDQKDSMVKAFNEKVLLKRAGEPSECAEAYLFVMKCGYITGQNIYVEGGHLLRAPVAAYLLGMGPMPPPTPQERAVTITNHILDGGQLREEEEESSSEDENIDPQLRTQPQLQVQNQVVAPLAPSRSIPLFACDVISDLAEARNVTVRVPLNNKVSRDIEFPADIPRQDSFFLLIYSESWPSL
ncbi:hypothetical protein CVT25_009586 [Psilocybe cyanescens]|uniref:Uncharacterized protein n=1 Tax=Psilocybe cyanescens TaxID=93625 RepID=A0A409XDM9_PSICY|nr:hypothetical protein CVT25_009586 [Psilocybe cyanescens]